MIYAFLGSDFSIVNSSVNELVRELNIDNIIKYDFSETTLRDILDEVNYVDLFNEKKLIIVSSFSFKKVKEEDEELLVKYIENMNDNVIILKCVDDALDDRRSLTKLLREKCVVKEIKKLDYKGLFDYVTNMFKEKKIEVTYNQVRKILELCDNNPDYTINEVNKLLLYKIGDKVLYDKDITDVVSRNTEKEMFRFTENVIKKDIAGSMDSFKILISSNIDAVIILDNVAKQFRVLMQVKELRSEKSETELSRILGVNPYTIKKLYPYINSYSFEEIADMLHKLSDVDVDIKVNGYDRNELMEKFIIEL